MATRFPHRIPVLDRVAVGLSGLCVLHCVASVVLVSALSVAGDALGDPVFHRVGLGAAMLLAAVALGQGYRAHRALRPALIGVTGVALMALGLVVPHGLAEVIATVAGVTILAAAHLLNTRVRI